MALLSWILLGFIAGHVGKWIASSKQHIGIIKTTLIGIAGAFVGGLIGLLFGIGDLGSFSIKSAILASAGAALLLWLLQRRNGKARS